MWPLPPTGLTIPREGERHRLFPDTETLIEIAIAEERNDDALAWYDHSPQRGMWHDPVGERVVVAVQRTHPDRALAIWLHRARAEIGQVKPSAYETAGAILARIKTVYDRTGRGAEWQQLLATLRAENARRPRMLQVLDRLARGRSRIVRTRPEARNTGPE